MRSSHVEKHFTSSALVRDIVIAGLTGAVNAANIIVTAGLAEIAAGSIAMGLGGYLAAKTDAEHYASERAREEREVIEIPDLEAAEVAEVFESYGLAKDTAAIVVDAIRKDNKRWVDFMMRFELGLEEPDANRARTSALTIALSYIAGGLVPLAPYFLLPTVKEGLVGSVVVTLMALFVFGYIKGKFTTPRPFRSAWQTVIVGGLAAGAAFLIAIAMEQRS
jgi:vacuolar iron transporter family protein